MCALMIIVRCACSVQVSQARIPGRASFGGGLPVAAAKYAAPQRTCPEILPRSPRSTTTSFEFRGALDKILSLSGEELDKGVVFVGRVVANFALVEHRQICK